MKLIQSRQEFSELFKSKKVAILAFNKDARNLLRFLKNDLKVVNFSIDYVFDLTLDYRNKVRDRALEVIEQDKIISDPEKLKSIIDAKKIDVILCFDRFGSLYAEESLNSFQDCYDRLKADHDNMMKEAKSSSAQYNFRWRVDVVDYINWYAATRGIDIVSPYWNDLFPYDNPHIERKIPGMTSFVTVRILEIVRAISDLPPGLRDAKVRFILGSDWGVGKTSFLLNRMAEGSFGMAEDAWFALVSDYFIPPVSASQVKGYIANDICEAWKENSKKDIYIKMGGRLEEYIYGIPSDSRLWLDNLPCYFKNSMFDIVLKPNQKGDDIKDILDDLKRYYNLTDDKISLRNMGYDGFEINP